MNQYKQINVVVTRIRQFKACKTFLYLVMPSHTSMEQQPGLSLAMKKALEILSKYQGGFVSKRDGLVAVKINDNGQTVIIWIRQTPITDKALNAFKKLIAKHKYDKLVLLKLYDAADLVSFSDLAIFNEIRHGEPGTNV